MGYMAMSSLKTLSRKELYELVWSMPVRDLAKQFDISDRGLAKKCETHKVPRPPQGYWLKNEQDRKRLVKPLPTNDDEWLETIDFFPRPESLKQSLKAKTDLNDEQLAVALEFKVPESVSRYHPLISKCRKAAKKQRLDNYSRFIFGRDALNPGFKVTPETFDRACLFLQGLVDLFSIYGWKLKDNADEAFFVYEDNDLAFEIKERVTKKDKSDTNPRQGLDGLGWQRRDYISTGKLEFSLTSVYSTGFKKRWYDGESEKLEDQLGSIVQGFSRAFDARRLWKIELEEQERQWQKKEAERKEQARIRKIEEDRRKHLFGMAEEFQKAKSIRDFLEALDRTPNKPEEMDKWLIWANAVIDEIDPLCHQEEIIEQHEKLAEKPQSLWS